LAAARGPRAAVVAVAHATLGVDGSLADVRTPRASPRTEPAQRLKVLAEIPVLVMTVEVSNHAEYDHRMIAF
jgi:hypothetical protein